jgi:hypothetical protein
LKAKRVEKRREWMKRHKRRRLVVSDFSFATYLRCCYCASHIVAFRCSLQHFCTSRDQYALQLSIQCYSSTQ